MPVMNGLEVQARLRHLSPCTGVIVVTSHDDRGVRSKAMDTSAKAFFLKPVDKNEFLTAVASTFASEARS
jgi:DNA-binding NarL/FixJ family response regulator